MEHLNTAAGKVIDPVCGMNVSPVTKDLSAAYKGVNYYFCAEACRKAFEKNPKKFLKPKGIWGRYLDRLNKATDGKKPSCCH